MNILIAGDLHFNKNQFQWLADQKEYFDCLCLTGDLLDGDNHEYIVV
jgi:predicted phosphodiesterase